jgi:flagellar hook-length control protein FliK
MGVAIARHVLTDGGDAMTVRLTPADMGRIEITLSFDDSGTLRAVMAADSPAALDMLRRDSADLGRALTDAGVRSDGASLRFDTRSSDGGGNGGSAGQFWQRRQDARAGNENADVEPSAQTNPTYRPLRTSGRVDMIA